MPGSVKLTMCLKISNIVTCSALIAMNFLNSNAIKINYFVPMYC